MIVFTALLALTWFALRSSSAERVRSTSQRAYARQQTRRQKLTAWHWNNEPIERG